MIDHLQLPMRCDPFAFVVDIDPGIQLLDARSGWRDLFMDGASSLADLDFPLLYSSVLLILDLDS